MSLHLLGVCMVWFAVASFFWLIFFAFVKIAGWKLDPVVIWCPWLAVRVFGRRSVSGKQMKQLYTYAVRLPAFSNVKNRAVSAAVRVNRLFVAERLTCGLSDPSIDMAFCFYNSRGEQLGGEGGVIPSSIAGSDPHSPGVPVVPALAYPADSQIRVEASLFPGVSIGRRRPFFVLLFHGFLEANNAG